VSGDSSTVEIFLALTCSGERKLSSLKPDPHHA
jgi:hypothetical protein